MKKKSQQKKPSPTVRSPGVTTYGVSGHETMKQLFLYVGCRVGKNRSKWLHTLAVTAIKGMMQSEEYAKDLEGIEFYFDEASGEQAARLPEHIANFRSPKRR